MKLQRRLVWSKGMFLTPQHMQAHTRHIEDELLFRSAALPLPFWGVTDLDIDPDALRNGLVQVTRLRAVWPDGLGVDIPDSDALMEPRDIKPVFPAEATALEVFAAIPVHTSAKRVSLHESVRATRFTVEDAKVLDENLGEEEKTIQVARKNLRVIVGDESQDGFLTLRIARILRNQEGVPVLDPQFVPPSLDIAASPFLLQMLRRQIEVLAARSSSLSNARRQHGKTLADFTISDVAQFWLLHTVNTAIPELQFYRKAAVAGGPAPLAKHRCHPALLHLAMARLAGALATFSLDFSAVNLPEYNHDDPGPSFVKLDEMIRAMLNAVIPSKCVPVVLRNVGRHHWQGTIEDHLLQNSTFYLAVGSDAGPEAVLRDVPKLVKIAGPAEFNDVVNKANAGVRLRNVDPVPASIPLKTKQKYFTLDQGDRLWQGIAQSRTIELFVPLSQPQIELLAVLD